MSGIGELPIDDNGKPVLGLYNDATGKIIPVHVKSTVTGADGNTYALLDTGASGGGGGGGAVTAVSGAFVANSIVDLTTLIANTADLLADGDHLATIDTSTAASKTDLDTIVTNTNKIPASPAQEAGNLATLVTNTADLLADGDHLATIDSGIASLVTNTADLLADGDHLATIDTNTANIPAKGTNTMANSSPVTIATNDTVFAELLTDTDNLATIATNTTGAATAANQTTTNTSLSTIATNTTGLATDAHASSIVTNTSNSATVEGATNDAAVVGDNTGTISAKLRGLTKIFNDIWDSVNHLFAVNVKQIGAQAPTLDNTTILATSMRGKNSVAGDTALQVNSDGSQWMDIRKYNGSAVGAANPQISSDQVRAYTLLGQSFSAAMTKQSTPTGTITLGWQLFNPANSGKSILIYSLVVAFNTSNSHDMRITTADESALTGWSNTAVTPVNNKAGSGTTSVATCGFSNVSVTGTPGGLTRETVGTQNNQSVETLTNGECILLPADTVLRGVALYLASGASGNAWAVTCSYLEY